MALVESMSKVLDRIYEEYRNEREIGSLSYDRVDKYREICGDILTGRMNALSDLGEMEGAEYAQCSFMKKILDNGWPPGDLAFFTKFYEGLQTLPQGQDRDKGFELLSRFEESKADSFDKRGTLIADMAGYIVPVMHNHQEISNNMLNDMNSLMNAKVSYTEYPDDNMLEEAFAKDGTFNPQMLVWNMVDLDIRKALLVSRDNHLKRSEDERQKIRDKNDYTMAELTDDALENIQFNFGQKKMGIVKTNRQAIKEVFGEEIYDDIDEAHKGTKEERTITIHHAKGNRQFRAGADVLEFDLAGSGFDEARKEYRGQHGNRNVFNVSKEELDRSIQVQYGDRAKDINGNTFEKIRVKDKKVKVGDKTFTKKRYTISGPGGLNVGKHSIENNRVYVRDFAKSHIEPLLQKWARGEEEPHDIQINITGHSRGSVASAESIIYINNWMKDYAKKHPECQQFMSRVKFDMLVRDPVPGFGTSIRFGSRDLRDIPNLNATVFCTMGQEWPDFAFPLEKIRGAKRIVIGTTEHGMDLSRIDLSQMNKKDDGLSHQAGFYDAENGEYYRGSGIAEMPEGIYIADDRNNLVRITNYSQIGKIVSAVHEGASKGIQTGRVGVIHEMVRDWFVDNTLSISYQSETERYTAQDKGKDAMDKIMKSDVSRLKPVKKEIEKLDKLMSSGASKEEIMEANSNLIKVCKAYVGKTKVPCTGDSEYRMNLVSDVLTFTERENNYLERGLDKKKDMTREGSLDRQIARENKRLANDKDIKAMMNDAADACKKSIEALSQTRKGNSNSVEYEQFINALKVGSTLSQNSSIEDYTRIMNNIKNVSDNYVKTHEGLLIGPVSDDGKTRLKYAQLLSTYSYKNIKVMSEKARTVGDKSASIDRVIEKRNNKLESLNNRKKNGNTKLTESEIVKEQLEEKIRIEADRYDRMRRLRSKPALAMNNVEMIAARLVYLKTVEEAAKQSGYANPSEIKRNLDDRMLDMAARPIMQSKEFSKIAGKTGVGKLKEAFEAAQKKPVAKAKPKSL
ncbi:MAG: hypothetical protein E7271_04090 [Lachnospiraceae bacterium]|jgi:hypothetical protein|nr:hypothetical protein [Lachnospiraceae bacterium]